MTSPWEWRMSMASWRGMKPGMGVMMVMVSFLRSILAVLKCFGSWYVSFLVYRGIPGSRFVLSSCFKKCDGMMTWSRAAKCVEAVAPASDNL
ncbi:hypothetical protein B0T10DRAFT_229180 [Thelonectria olida]|uniref:Uncharacterized protein n=1 Tax=Thelonectria olida TaxID=1576542 RepID=A0A9P8WC77_9HYPO|nr:hypothetical protein B0T10DRAFT_229180 [Thelonectria olida]